MLLPARFAGLHCQVRAWARVGFQCRVCQWMCQWMCQWTNVVCPQVWGSSTATSPPFWRQTRLIVVVRAGLARAAHSMILILGQSVPSMPPASTWLIKLVGGGLYCIVRHGCCCFLSLSKLVAYCHCLSWFVGNICCCTVTGHCLDPA
jgi:hypothetical protein